MSDDELERIKNSPGWQLFQSIHKGSGADERLVEFFKDFPGMLTYEAEFAYDVWARPGLDLRSRSLITISVLAALGTNPQQLQTHINAALNCGWATPQRTGTRPAAALTTAPRTLRRDGSSREAVSPVEPSASTPCTPPARTCSTSRAVAGSSTAPSR